MNLNATKPIISGTKLFAIARVLLQEQPHLLLLLGPIWMERREISPETILNQPQKENAPGEDWEFQVTIPKADAQGIRTVLWDIAAARSASEPKAVASVADLARAWDQVCGQL